MSKINELYQTHVHYELQTFEKKEHNVLNKDKIHQKILAFLSEIGKISEESRCFSFWDTSPIDTDALLAYYIDALQFLLSIGFDIQVDAIKQYPELNRETTLLEQFLKLYQDTMTLQKSYQFMDYQHIIDDFFHLGFLLGYDIDTIIQGYKEHVKNT